MHFSTKITRIASTPPWANVTNVDGTDGFWVDTNAGDKVFLRKQDHVIWLPKSLRGRKVQDLMPEDLKMLPKEDSGKTHYEAWRARNDAEMSLSKLHNGYAFQAQGQALLDRLVKLVEKYELDNVGNLGLDPKYSINPALFQKLVQTNNRDDVKRWGRVIAKKFTMVIHLLNQVNPKLAKRLDADFMFAYKKLMPLFDFDPAQYQPPVPQAQPGEPEGVTTPHLLVGALEKAIKEIRPIMSQDLAFFPIMQGFVRLLGMLKAFNYEAMEQYQEAYTDLIAQMLDLGRQPRSDNPFAVDTSQLALQVVASPALQEFHALLMEPVADESLQ